MAFDTKRQMVEKKVEIKKCSVFCSENESAPSFIVFSNVAKTKHNITGGKTFCSVSPHKSFSSRHKKCCFLRNLRGNRRHPPTYDVSQHVSRLGGGKDQEPVCVERLINYP